jgi:hypothetical protein
MWIDITDQLTHTNTVLSQIDGIASLESSAQILVLYASVSAFSAVVGDDQIQGKNDKSTTFQLKKGPSKHFKIKTI